jgi:hypothetical protein
MSEQSAPSQPPPQARLAQMATGFILSRLVYTAASLGIADQLASGPKSAGELATPTGCDAVSLFRFMRTLTNFGILALGDDEQFALTSLGEPLRSDAPGSVRSSILSMAGQWSWQLGRRFRQRSRLASRLSTRCSACRSSTCSHRTRAKRFSETMVAYHGAEPRPLPRRTTSRRAA